MTAVWLKVPIEQSDLIPVAARQGFVFHHAESQYSMLCTWLSSKIQSKLPKFASHQVGVAGMFQIRAKTQTKLPEFVFYSYKQELLSPSLSAVELGDKIEI